MYQAKITPGSFAAYRFALSVPSDLSIDEIAVSMGNKQVPLRWSRSAENRVTVFHGNEVTKDYRLVLSGTVPLEAGGKVHIPRIAAVANDAATQQVRIYRADDVHVELQGISVSAESKTEPLEAPPDPMVGATGRYLLSR